MGRIVVVAERNPVEGNVVLAVGETTPGGLGVPQRAVRIRGHEIRREFERFVIIRGRRGDVLNDLVRNRRARLDGVEIALRRRKSRRSAGRRLGPHCILLVADRRGFDVYRSDAGRRGRLRLSGRDAKRQRECGNTGRNRDLEQWSTRKLIHGHSSPSAHVAQSDILGGRCSCENDGQLNLL